MRARQLSFLPSPATEHGGVLKQGKRKEMRPFDPKRPLHVVLRSSKARGTRSMLTRENRAFIAKILNLSARKHSIKLMKSANVGNHLHLLVLARRRQQLRAFLREVSGTIAMKLTGACKGSEARTAFWDFRPYSRIVSWGRDLNNLKLYFVKNLFEAAGLLTNRMKRSGVRVVAISSRGWGEVGAG